MNSSPLAWLCIRERCGGGGGENRDFCFLRRNSRSHFDNLIDSTQGLGFYSSTTSNRISEGQIERERQDTDGQTDSDEFHEFNKTGHTSSLMFELTIFFLVPYPFVCKCRDAVTKVYIDDSVEAFTAGERLFQTVYGFLG